MFVLFNENTRFPVKVWLQDESKLEENCLEQAYHLSNLPFIHKWVCLMPDTHAGKGMPIGGVIAAKDVIIPNAVGVDIGCGTVFTATNIKVNDIKDIMTGNGSLIQAMIGAIMRAVPLGVERHKTPQESIVLDKTKDEMWKYEANKELIPLIEDGYYQVGTLGGGNHFITQSPIR